MIYLAIEIARNLEGINDRSKEAYTKDHKDEEAKEVRWPIPVAITLVLKPKSAFSFYCDLFGLRSIVIADFMRSLKYIYPNNCRQQPNSLPWRRTPIFQHFRDCHSMNPTSFILHLFSVVFPLFWCRHLDLSHCLPISRTTSLLLSQLPRIPRYLILQWPTFQFSSAVCVANVTQFIAIKLFSLTQIIAQEHLSVVWLRKSISNILKAKR